MAQATRAPLEIELGGKTRRLSPLKLIDLGVIVNKLGAKAITAAHASARQTNDKKLKTEILDGAYRFAASVEVMGPDMANYFGTFEGLITLLTLSIQVTQPEFTEEEAFKILTEDANARLEFAKAMGSMLPSATQRSDPKADQEEASD